jgi:hypothetical protein
MTRDCAVRNFRGSFPDGDSIGDLTARVLEDTRVLRATHAPLGSLVIHQLFFQHSETFLVPTFLASRFAQGDAGARTCDAMRRQTSYNQFRATFRAAGKKRSQRAHYKVEALFAELKQQIKLHKARLRRVWNVAEQFYLAVAAKTLQVNGYRVHRGHTLLRSTRIPIMGHLSQLRTPAVF